MPVGNSLLAPGSTNQWKQSAISRWRRCTPAEGGTTSPYVEKGTNRGVATGPRMENENIHFPHPGRKAYGSPY